jgi:hypothetical protein
MAKFFKDWNKNSSMKTLLGAIQQRELPGAYGEPLEYFKRMDKEDVIEILIQTDKESGYEDAKKKPSTKKDTKVASSKLRSSKDKKFNGHTGRG